MIKGFQWVWLLAIYFLNLSNSEYDGTSDIRAHERVFFSQFNTAFLSFFLVKSCGRYKSVNTNPEVFLLPHKYSLLETWGPGWHRDKSGPNKESCLPRGIWQPPRTDVLSLVTASHRLQPFSRFSWLFFSDFFSPDYMMVKIVSFLTTNNTWLCAVINF